MEAKNPRSYLTVIIILLLLLGFSTDSVQPCSAAPASQLSVDEIVSLMTPEELIGQLFLVEIIGTPGSDDQKIWGGEPGIIKELIQDYRVGGIVLLGGNKNFYNNSEAAVQDQIAMLTNELQQYAYEAGIPQEAPTEKDRIPLLIALDHEGDGWPYTRARDGLTPLPSNMALNATWSEELVQRVGRAVGQELSAMGVNMLLGPVVDVLDRPRPEGKGDMGVRLMGSNPEWVGKLGRAYIRGVHEGSAGQNGHPKIATVAKHFPGHGGSNRLPDDDVAIIPKNINELREFELIPFARTADITGNDALGVTDALMTSHIVYLLHGQETEPVSLDSEAMEELLTLPEFATWYQQGVIVSDSLGVLALQRHFGRSFSYNDVAYDSLMAGNDLLIIANWNSYPRIQGALDFFRDTYQTDRIFRARVKEAAKKVVALKRKLYPEFVLEQVLVNEDDLSPIRPNNDLTRQIAENAVTLIHPNSFRALPSPPSRDDKIVIISNTKSVADCYGCNRFEALPRTAIEQQLIRLYGPNGFDRVNPELISSWTFQELLKLINNQADDATVQLQNALNQADWIIFGLLDWGFEEKAVDQAINSFLDWVDRPRRAKLVAIAYGAPYYLDITYIRKLDAYFALYSKIDPFIEVSVRALFQDIEATGHSPVDVGRYRVSDYIQQLSTPAPTPTVTPSSTPTSEPASTPTATSAPSSTPTSEPASTLVATSAPSPTLTPELTVEISSAVSSEELTSTSRPENEPETKPERLANSLWENQGVLGIIAAVIGAIGVIIAAIIPLIRRSR